MNGAVFAWAVVVPLLLASAQGELVFEKQRLEFAPPASEKKVEAKFLFTNKGKEPVTIRKVTTNCGCTTAKLAKETVLPGESGEITAKFAFGFRKGLQIKHVLVESDDPVTPQVSLELKVMISDRVQVRPSLLFWKKDETAEPKTITLELRDGYTLDSLNVTPSDPRIEVASKPLPDGKGFAISVKPKRGGEPIRATLKIEMNKGKEDAVTSLAHVKVD